MFSLTLQSLKKLLHSSTAIFRGVPPPLKVQATSVWKNPTTTFLLFLCQLQFVNIWLINAWSLTKNAWRPSWTFLFFLFDQHVAPASRRLHSLLVRGYHIIITRARTFLPKLLSPFVIFFEGSRGKFQLGHFCLQQLLVASLYLQLLIFILGVDSNRNQKLHYYHPK